MHRTKPLPAMLAVAGILTLSVALPLSAQAPSAPPATSLPPLGGEEILRRVDANNVIDTMAYVGTMEIDLGSRVLRKEMRVVAKGESRSFIEFSNPEDKGVRYLKVDKDLWMYFPSEQETVKISGHLLKEGMMGSDLSYEDALESGAISDDYSIGIEGVETLDGRPCYVLELKATSRSARYDRQRLWVDGERFVVWKTEMYAKSGRLLKESRVLEVGCFGERWFPTRVKMEDKLRKGGGTTFTLRELRFGVALPDDMFSLQRLSR